MLRKVLNRRVMVCLAIASFVVFGACGGSGLPSQVTVELPDGTEVVTTMGSGVISLANTTWALQQKGSAQTLLELTFDSEGSLSRFDNNTIAAAIFGDTIIFDGQRHNTSQAGVQYAAATFGAETSDATGFTFVGQLTGYAAGLEAATATATAMAEFDPEDASVITGTLDFTSRVTLLDIPEGNIDMEIEFIGNRVD